MGVRINYIATVLFFLQFFFVRIFIGGLGGSYESYTQFNLSWICYLCELLIILFFIHYVLRVRLVHDLKKLLNSFLLLLLIEVFQILFILLLSDINNIGMLLLYYFRFILVLFTNVVFFLYFYERKTFINIFFKFSAVSIVFSLFFLSMHLLFGSNIQIHIADGFPRVQGFFSEPSGFSGTLAAFIGICILERRRVWFFLALICAINTQSVIVYITILFSLLFLFSSKISLRKISIILSLLIISIGIGLKSFSSIEFSGTFLRISDLIKNLGEIKEMDSSVLKNLDMDRVYGLMVTLEDIIKDNLMFSGYGVNGSSYIFVQRYEDVMDYGLLAFFISSFGVIFGVLLVFYIGKNLLRVYREDRIIGLIGVCFFIAVLGNSAEGILMYSVSLSIAYYEAVFKGFSRLKLKIS
ncbi:hypothetical protein [Flavobacterium laiguense]|uniref:Uncharacterized protein n=1 Tax=Flavobacterium laiguense TaxID=2169409 RepID=A0A2U1JXG6_9FLAO|nr:hypothetical protein [Flavobacterium laiguense]PWA09911.1 hypothetical protein DB891_06995 [Flavobacterium laiguense]